MSVSQSALTYAEAFRAEGNVVEGDVAAGGDALAGLELHVIPGQANRKGLSKPQLEN